MFSVSPEAYQTVWQVSRFLFALAGVLLLIAFLGWLISEVKDQKDIRRADPSAGTVGELVVISGSRELPAQTWFPVIRDGVLGSVRSCDLVVPADGVRPHHLDFCWKDGVGLLIRPRSGCEVHVNDVLLDCKSDPESAPLIHGASLQVGSAVLRLHLFAALDSVSVSRSAVPEADAPIIPLQPVPGSSVYPLQPVSGSSAYPVSPVPDSVGYSPFPGPVYEYSPEQIQMVPPQASVPEQNSMPAPVSPPPARRSSRWKEDWSE